MRVLVYGAGVIGCYLGHVLCGAGQDVTLLARGEWKETLQQKGLVIEHSLQKKTTIDYPTVIGALDETRYDAVFAVMQHHQMKEILPELARVNSPLVVLVGNTFTMPASKVTVKAAFAETEEENPFVDVPKGAYYFDAVLWAAGKGITGGTDAAHFSPDSACTRAQAVTFLWRAAGCPAPKSSEMPFTDVPEGSYYEQAVLWAVEQGITKGTTDTTFSPNAKCTRAQIVTFLWRSQGSPAAGTANPFTDVAADAYYAGAVLWAAENGITGGTTATTFSPNATCTRAQIVTFLYRCLGEE